MQIVDFITWVHHFKGQYKNFVFMKKKFINKKLSPCTPNRTVYQKPGKALALLSQLQTAFL